MGKLIGIGRFETGREILVSFYPPCYNFLVLSVLCGIVCVPLLVALKIVDVYRQTYPTLLYSVFHNVFYSWTSTSVATRSVSHCAPINYH